MCLRAKHLFSKTIFLIFISEISVKMNLRIIKIKYTADLKIEFATKSICGNVAPPNLLTLRRPNDQGVHVLVLPYLAQTVKVR